MKDGCLGARVAYEPFAALWFQALIFQAYTDIDGQIMQARLSPFLLRTGMRWGSYGKDAQWHAA